MFKGKKIVVALVDEAKKAYLELQVTVKEEREKNRHGTEHQKLLASINKTIEQLKVDPQYGTHIKKDRIPRTYKEQYDVTNLWKCDLALFWRMIYWIDGMDEVKIVGFVLDILDHESYNNRFGYRKR